MKLQEMLGAVSKMLPISKYGLDGCVRLGWIDDRSGPSKDTKRIKISL